MILRVKARPGARRGGIRGDATGALKVSVTQSAEKGKANRAIVELLAQELGLRRSQIDLVTGAASPEKRFLVRGVSVQNLSRRIDEAIVRAGGFKGPES